MTPEKLYQLNRFVDAVQLCPYIWQSTLMQ